MLKRLKVHNFRSFLNFEVNFSPLHLVIGKNNSGKTNLARAIHFLGWTATAPLNDAIAVVPGGFFEFAHRGLRQNITTFSCTCELDFEGALTQYTYDLVLRHNTDAAGQSELVVVSEKLVANATGFANATLLENNGAESRMLHESNYEQGRLHLAGPTLSRVHDTLGGPQLTYAGRLSQ
jgi:predicted ATPase